MRFGFVLPGGTAGEQVEQAVLAERSGWDGIFVWEGVAGVDPWSLLAAMSQHTSRVRLGTMLTPLPWRRPWKVASQVATLDQLSGGRAVLAVGLGATDILPAGSIEPTDRRLRAELLDEGIDLITAAQAGRPHSGRHYGDYEVRADLVPMARPVQQPRVPIWVVGAWPRPKSMRRVLRCDGVLPLCMGEDGYRDTSPDDIRAMLAWLEAEGGPRPGFDVVVDGETPAGDPQAAAALVAPWAAVGCTWWLDVRWETSPDQMTRVQERLAAGPPPLA